MKMPIKSEKTKDPSEQQIQKAVLQFLQYSPRVVWVDRINSGAVAGFVFCSDIRKVMYGNKDNIIGGLEGLMKRKRQTVKLADSGTADIIGMLKGGQMFAFEVKRPGQKPREDQREFLDKIKKNGGLSAVVSSIDDAMEAING